MASTRFYFHIGPTCPVSPAINTVWSTSAVTGATGFLLPKKCANGIIETASFTASQGLNSTTERGFFASPPLRAQTISGNVKGQMLCKVASIGNLATLALSIRVIKPDHTVRGTLLATVGSDDLVNTPPNFAVGTLTNRPFQDASENTTIALTSTAVSEGDYLLVEYGCRQNIASNETVTIQCGADPAFGDLPEDSTSTDSGLNPWIEFDSDITFWDCFFFAISSNPTDNGSANEPSTLACTTPSGMDNDKYSYLACLIGMIQVVTAGQISLNQQSGQTWTKRGEANFNDASMALWSATWNGTWGASPSLDFASQSGTQPTSDVLIIFAGPPGHNWNEDVAFAGATQAAPASPFTCTITGQTPTRRQTISLAGWGVTAANTWTSLTAGWAYCGLDSNANNGACWRNTAGSDQSMIFAYKYTDVPAATGNVSLNESAGTAGLKFMDTFSPTVANLIYKRDPMRAHLVR